MLIKKRRIIDRMKKLYFVKKIVKLAKKTPYLFIIGFIGIILAAVVLFQTKLQKPQYINVRIKGSPGNWWWVTPRPPDWLAYSIRKGDKEYNSLNQPIAEVLEVSVYDAGGSTKDVYLLVKLEVKYNKQTRNYRYKGEPLEIGGPISMSLDRTFFPGMVVAIYDEEYQLTELEEKTIVVRYASRWPYEYEAIKIGEKMTDGSGRVLAEIIDKQRKPAEKEVTTYDGRLVKNFSPVFDDFFVTIRLRANHIGEEFIFREEQYLKIGNAVWILFPHYNLSGAQIMSIE